MIQRPDGYASSAATWLGALAESRESLCPIPGREKGFSPEWILYNLLDHVANHRGQVALLKRLLRS